MPEIPALFDRHLDFDPPSDFEAFVRQAPAKWVVYLLADVDDRPIQLLCVKNLRASLKRRLGGEEQPTLSRRVDYREIVRWIHWRRVDSAFEADWLYFEAARQLFPGTYQGMVGFRPAWFVHVNPEAPFPRYTKTINLPGKTGLLLGPLEDKHAAARLVQLTEDAFDLCRYYAILVESPNAKACAYKEMGKCPAPCDGSISMDQYRNLIDWSAQTLIEPTGFLRDQAGRMQHAAAELKFESAAKIKSFLDSLGQLGKGSFRYVRRIEDFRFLSLQHGPRAGTAKLFLITPGHIEELAGLLAEPSDCTDLLQLALQRSADQIAEIDSVGSERIGIVTHHLFAPRHKGVFLPLLSANEKSLPRLFRDLSKQSLPEESEAEGVLKELQSL